MSEQPKQPVAENKEEKTGENVQINLNDEIAKMRLKVEQLKQKKKSLENENDNLSNKIDDLRLIINRISDES